MELIISFFSGGLFGMAVLGLVASRQRSRKKKAGKENQETKEITEQ